MNNTSFEPKTIEESFKKNFAEYIDVFLNFQSTFLSNLNTRYKNLDNAHLVLLFGRRAHETILKKRKKKYSYNFDPFVFSCGCARYFCKQRLINLKSS